MKISMHVDGSKEFARMLTVAGVKAPSVLASALYVEAQEIMTEAKQAAPIDLGTLRASGHVNKPKVSKTGASVQLGFGGAAAAYALAVHEHPSEHSPPSWQSGVRFNQGGPKYLERPVREAQKGFADRLARHMKLF
jgi:hypothetical protein